MLDKPNILIKRFKQVHGYDLNLKNPLTLSEKIQWIKLFGNLERFSKYVDKYEVRQYIKEKIGEHYLIPLIGVYDSVDKIPYDSLPKRFVMKATHGSGWNIIVKDKSTIEWNDSRKKLEKWINTNFYHLNGERQYKPLKGRVLIEEYLEDASGVLRDFKLFCFHGVPKFIQVNEYRLNGLMSDIYDLKWNKLPYEVIYKNLPKPVPKPKRLTEMIATAQQLSEGFAFVRVDLYYVNERIYFGELTFTPHNGMIKKPLDFEKFTGNMLNLTKYL